LVMRTTGAGDRNRGPPSSVLDGVAERAAGKVTPRLYRPPGGTINAAGTGPATGGLFPVPAGALWL